MLRAQPGEATVGPLVVDRTETARLSQSTGYRIGGSQVDDARDVFSRNRGVSAPTGRIPIAHTRFNVHFHHARPRLGGCLPRDGHAPCATFLPR